MSENSPELSQIKSYVDSLVTSPAPAALKLAAQALLNQSLARTSLDAEAHVIDELANAISQLPGTLACHLDLLRLLRGEVVRHTQHRRTNLGAALRDKARRLGRPPAEHDFPTEHPIHAFALPYWGGIAAWSSRSDRQTQRRQGYWGVRANQIDALRSAVAEYPGVPVTHALLRLASLHRLAVTLDAAGLAALAEEAGIDRALIYKTSSWWTVSRVVDAYAQQCREAGVTLSSTALSALGGEASSLRVYASRHFGNFRAFQAAVTAQHSDIQLPDRPITVDGVAMDSWSEVVAYNAVLAAMPTVRIEVHVALPDEPARSPRSCDLRIDGRVWVEILGVALDAMSSATSKRQRKYAMQWEAKLARYNALHIRPIIIEPADIHDPQRLAERVAEIAHQLGKEPPPQPPSGTRTVRAKGGWTFEALCQAVADVAGASGTLPTQAALAAAGYGHAAQLLRRPGERQRVATALQLRDDNYKGVWTRAHVVNELAILARAQSGMPTRAQLRRDGRGALASAADRLWADDRAGLRCAVEQAAGIPLTPRRAANGSLSTPAQLVAALKPLAADLGRMPSCTEAAHAGLSTAWARASRTVGVAGMARLLDVPYGGPERRTRTEMLREFVRLAASSGTQPLTTTMITMAIGAGGLARLRKCGGIAAVRAEIERVSRMGGQSA